MRKIYLLFILTGLIIFPAIGQEISDTAFIRIVELMGMESQLQRYFNTGTFSQSDEKRLVVSDLKDQPVFKGYSQTPYLAWDAADSKNAICQYGYITDHEIKRYILPVKLFENADSIYMSFEIINNLNEKVHGNFVYIPHGKAFRYYHRLDLTVDDNNGNITTKSLSGRINRYYENGAKLSYQTANQKINAVMRQILNNRIIEESMYKERGRNMYPMYLVYRKDFMSKILMDGFITDTSDVQKEEFDKCHSVLKVTNFEYDKWSDVFKLKLTYNDKITFSVKASKRASRNEWYLSNILVKND